MVWFVTTDQFAVTYKLIAPHVICNSDFGRALLTTVYSIAAIGSCTWRINKYIIWIPQTLYQRDVSDSAFLTTYHSLHIQHLKRSSWGWTVTVRNMRTDTWASINNQCCYIVYLVGMYIYCKKWYTDLPMSRILSTGRTHFLICGYWPFEAEIEWPTYCAKDPEFKWPLITLHDLGQQHQWMFSFLSITLCVNCSRLLAWRVKPYTQYCCLTKTLFFSFCFITGTLRNMYVFFASDENNFVCDIFKLQ